MMNENEPLISIVVPVYNAVKCIEDTIQAIRSQTFSDWELIMVDDCSTDDSIEIMKSYESKSIKLIRLKEGSGAAFARNAGIDAARGRYIAFVDADDLWSPDKLERQLAFMKENNCAFSLSNMLIYNTKGDLIDVRKHEDITQFKNKEL